MELNQALERLEESKEFEEWKKKNPETFFSYAMKTSDNDAWHLGLYHKATDKITTFVIDQEIEMQQEEEIFKKPDMEVNPIDMVKIKAPYKKILKIAENFQKKKYPKELASKTIAILQNLKQYDTLWNITFVMYSFKTLNMKINPENGKIITHNLESLMNLIKK